MQATLVKRPEDLAVFSSLFDECFPLRRGGDSPHRWSCSRRDCRRRAAGCWHRRHRPERRAAAGFPRRGHGRPPTARGRCCRPFRGDGHHNGWRAVLPPPCPACPRPREPAGSAMVEGTQDTVEEVPLAARRGVHPRVAVDSIDREQSEGVDVRVAQCPEQLGAEVGVGDANTRRRAGDRSRREHDHLWGRVTTTAEREALVEQRREDREVLGPLDQRRLHRGAQSVAIEQIDVPHRRRRVEHLTERDVDAAVSQCGEQAKQHREDAIACGCHRLPSLTFISATLSSSACRIGPLSSSRLTRPAWVDTLIAAIARPDRSRNGAATDRTQSSSSSSTNAHPCERTWRINPRSRVGSVSGARTASRPASRRAARAARRRADRRAARGPST